MMKLLAYALGVITTFMIPLEQKEVVIQVGSTVQIQVLAEQRLEEVVQLSEFDSEVLNLVNEARAHRGYAPLEWDVDLVPAAQVRAKESATCWSHTRPDGTEFWTVNVSLAYGENLGKSNEYNADGMFSAWMNSPSHKENILFPDFRTMALGTYKKDGLFYVAQLFGY